jgi:hypothetical protein
MSLNDCSPTGVNGMDRVQKALHSVDLRGRGLEVGPSYNPLVTKAGGARIETVDHASQAELVTKYRALNVPQESLDRIEPVDHLWHGGSLLDVIPERGVYDYILASHFIEHTVDLIGFLTDCQTLLADGGRLSLIVPDKRFCFDRFQPLSTLGSILDAHLAGSRFHPAGALVDHQAYACTSGGVLAWSPGWNQQMAAQFPLLQGARSAMENGQAQETYFDVHRWRFTPTSFELLIGDLRRLGQHSFGVQESFPTEGFEFFVTLGKDVAEPAEHDRIAVLLEIEREIQDPCGERAQEIALLSAGYDELRAANDELQAGKDAVQARIDELHASRSWRLTRPVRAAGGLARRVVNR